MENLSDQTVQRMTQFLTTEHFTLQGARNATISEANGRLGHYISTVGSGVGGLAFVANVSSLGPVFLAFSAVIFPIMIVLGVVTLIRTIQIGVDFERLAQATNRIRHFYIEIAPEAEPYFSFPRFDDPQAVRQSMMPFHFRLQGLASTPGPVILINSVLVAAFAGILAVGFFSAGFGLAVLIAFLALGVGFVLHMLYSRRLCWKVSGTWKCVSRRHRSEIRLNEPDPSSRFGWRQRSLGTHALGGGGDWGQVTGD
jgi:hypothetical protein